jgi:predicted nicotinamide N-methyase
MPDQPVPGRSDLFELRLHQDDVPSPPVASAEAEALGPWFGHYLAEQSPPLLPELRLWLLSGRVDLNARCSELLAGGYAPYWAFCWGSGQALARHVLDHPQLVAGKVVVDFGAGSGVAAVAAARAGAARVIAVDNDPQARRVLPLNAALNGVELTVAAELPVDCEVLLASDVLYEAPLARLLQAECDAGRDVYVADPHRSGGARLVATPFAAISATTFPDVDYPICTAFLYRLAANGAPIPFLGRVETSGAS